MRILLTLRRSVQKFPPGGACVEVGIRKGGEETSTSVARPPSRVFPPTLKSSLSPKAHYSLLLLLMRRNLRVASKKKEKQLRKNEIVIIYNH